MAGSDAVIDGVFDVDRVATVKPGIAGDVRSTQSTVAVQVNAMASRAMLLEERATDTYGVLPQAGIPQCP